MTISPVLSSNWWRCRRLWGIKMEVVGERESLVKQAGDIYVLSSAQ